MSERPPAPISVQALAQSGSHASKECSKPGYEDSSRDGSTKQAEAQGFC